MNWRLQILHLVLTISRCEEEHDFVRSLLSFNNNNNQRRKVYSTDIKFQEPKLGT